jgi:hypothetical protein
MSGREQYIPRPASGAQIRKDGDKRTLILVREMRHSPEKVWQALTDPAHLREWAPFDPEAMKFAGWQRLNAEYAKQLQTDQKS